MSIVRSSARWWAYSLRRGLSGTGPKAGGPHALGRYAVERAVSVNIASRAAIRRFSISDQCAISTAIAVASPPPMQRLATPRFNPLALSAEIKVARMRAPDAPMG